MLKHVKFLLLGATLAIVTPHTLNALDTLESYIKEYPNQQQTKMMQIWLSKHKQATFSFTGLVDPKDDTVVTPQATVDYGYNWFSVSDKPAILKTPRYSKFFSVSIFDMKHNIPAVIVNPKRPIVIKRPNQKTPEGNYTVVNLETDQGLIFTRMLVVDNLKEVEGLRKDFQMTGGKGSMCRNVQKFSPSIEKRALGIIKATIPYLDPDETFGKTSGDVGFISLAGGVMMGQLGTPPDTVRYEMVLADEFNKPFNGKDTYVLTVPANIVKKAGYFSVTVYGSDNKLLIPNKAKRYDRTTYSSKQNKDGTYTITLSPSGEGLNGIPTGKPFYALLRAYVPVKGASLKVKVKNQQGKK